MVRIPPKFDCTNTPTVYPPRFSGNFLDEVPMPPLYPKKIMATAMAISATVSMAKMLPKVTGLARAPPTRKPKTGAGTGIYEPNQAAPDHYDDEYLIEPASAAANARTIPSRSTSS